MSKKTIPEQTSKLSDLNPLDQSDQKIFQLISDGVLPGADSVTKSGKPAWSFHSLATLIGCGEEELIELLVARSAGVRDAGSPRR